MIGRSIIAFLFFLICFNGQSQNTGKAQNSCGFLLRELEAAESSSNFNLAVRYGIIRERSCPQFEKSDYSRLLKNLKNAITNEKVMEKRSFYIDTICQIYQKMERKQLYDENDDLIRATYLIKSSKPDYSKADTLYTRAFKNSKSSLSDLHVNLYAFTILQLFNSADEKSKTEYKLRMINTYFYLSEYISKTGLSPKTQQNIETYFKGVIKDCNDLDKSLNDHLFRSSKTNNDLVSSLMNVKKANEFHTCYRSEPYFTVIDSLLSINPVAEVNYAKAKIIFDGHTKCGSNTFDQKLSLFYALQFLELARSKGMDVKALEKLIQSSLPSDNELLKNGIDHGQKVKISCWDVEIIIP